jgi:hypothetical protein
LCSSFIICFAPHAWLWHFSGSLILPASFATQTAAPQRSHANLATLHARGECDVQRKMNTCVIADRDRWREEHTLLLCNSSIANWQQSALLQILFPHAECACASQQDPTAARASHDGRHVADARDHAVDSHERLDFGSKWQSRKPLETQCANRHAAAARTPHVGRNKSLRA